MGEPEAETAKKPASNRSTKERRNTLFRVLDGVLSLSHKKFTLKETATRLSKTGSAFLVSVASTYGNLLKDKELELGAIAVELKNTY